MELSIHRLGIFLEVIRSGSISAAAKKLYMSQPSVSNQVRGLESSLNANLLNRSSSGATPTAAGEIVAGHAREIFELLDRIEEEVGTEQGLKTGRLAVAGTTTIGTYLLPRAFAIFSATAPGIRPELRVGNEETVVSWLLKGEVGLGIFAGEPDAEHLVSTPVFDDSLILVAAPASPLADRRLTPPDLLRERFLMREIGSATRHLQEDALARWNLDHVECWTMWGPDTLKESVRAGLGLALMSEHAAQLELSNGLLAKLEITPGPPSRPVSLVRKADRVLSPAESAFAELIKSFGSWPEEG
ncbi:LysR family transcriptional regulator [Saxibacter everestensis]|uniref:LysR family transcriptional regulator n=1 Tax=Saxibacter everestensis TaxID=2909229 RepID=A0ABY8QTB3_9MICO|nr:LysR family transcriptional regulator [Brevibacteriaceae bacterium ZFBP1038]